LLSEVAVTGDHNLHVQGAADYNFVFQQNPISLGSQM